MENRLNHQQYGIPVRPTPLPANGPTRMRWTESEDALLNRVLEVPTSQVPNAVRTLEAGPSSSKKARKDRGLNWTLQEVFTLIRAKKHTQMQEEHTADARDLMHTDTHKWIRISQIVMTAGFSPCPQDGPACKTKWNQLLLDYERTSDYHGRSGHNVTDFWDLSTTQHKQKGLPCQFVRDFYDAMHEWFSQRPQIQLVHQCDLLSPQDSNYRTPLHEQDEINASSDADIDDPIRVAEAGENESRSFSPTQRPPVRSNSDPPPFPCGRSGSGGPPPTPFTAVPTSMNPVLISSSDTTGDTSQRRPGNTVVRRKNFSGYALVADAMKNAGELMSIQMRNIADASLDVERSKIQVQLQLFSQQLSYQTERDRCLHESALATHENARLAIMKQNDMVQCLSRLTTVLGSHLASHTTPESDEAAALGHLLLPLRTTPQSPSPRLSRTRPYGITRRNLAISTVTETSCSVVLMRAALESLMTVQF